MEVAMEMPASTKFENNLNKMAESHFAILNQSDVGQLKDSSKNQNNLKTNLLESLAKLGDRMESQPENWRVWAIRAR